MASGSCCSVAKVRFQFFTNYFRKLRIGELSDGGNFIPVLSRNRKGCLLWRRMVILFFKVGKVVFVVTCKLSWPLVIVTQISKEGALKLRIAMDYLKPGKFGTDVNGPRGLTEIDRGLIFLNVKFFPLYCCEMFLIHLTEGMSTSDLLKPKSFTSSLSNIN